MTDSIAETVPDQPSWHIVKGGCIEAFVLPRSFASFDVMKHRRSLRRPPGRSEEHDRMLAAMSEVLGRWTVEEFFAGTRPPTDDDVPTALDGTPLDTKAKLIEYLEEIDAERERAARHPG